MRFQIDRKRMNKLKSTISSIPIFGPAAKMIFRWHKNPARLIRKLPTEAQIVQIGSNDGMQGDPLFEVLKSRPNWKALFVEPVPYVFERLIANYGDSPNYRFCNAAINNGERMTFYYVDSSANEHLANLPFWYDQLGSFNRDHIVNHLDGILEPYILEASVDGCSLADLFSKYSVSSIDLLHIDTEGYDWKILSQLNLSEITPTMILFERAHLSKTDKIEAVAFLKNDYFLYHYGMDALAIHKKSIKELNPMARRAASEL